MSEIFDNAFLKNAIYYGIIVALVLWILIYGSVYETQYYDFIYMYGDELLIILALVIITIYVMKQDFIVGLLLFLAIFFITNDLPIIHKTLLDNQEQESEEGFKNMISSGVNDFVQNATEMLNRERNMEGLVGSLNVLLNKAKLSRF